MRKDKLLALLDIVIENYIEKGAPVGSKFLCTLDDIKAAPSTLRKYLGVLEDEWLVYQPYNSSGRVPTVDGLTAYIDSFIEDESTGIVPVDLDTDLARNSLRYLVEKLGEWSDGVVCVDFWTMMSTTIYEWIIFSNMLVKNKRQ